MYNNEFNVFEKITNDERKDWHLYKDAVNKAKPDLKDMSAEVLSKLLGVKNQGGFRYLGKTEAPNLVILFTSGEDIYWRDELDNSLGLFLYYGDNKTPGNDLHCTKLHGNEILRYIFELASSDESEKRRNIPPIFVFKKYTGRDVKFLGLAVPGLKGKPTKDWLTAVWGANKKGDRFQNYKAYFTILNTTSGCEEEPNESGINLAWINDIVSGNAYDSIYAPISWKQYVNNNIYNPLVTRIEKYVKTKDEQLPIEKEKKRMLSLLQSFFVKKDRGYSFEKFAAYITECMDSSIASIDVTRPFKDGGFDAEGKYRIFKDVGNSLLVDFYLQAKCYNLTNPVTVKDTSRLISRIKNRQFGIMITTSYVANQAYKEILDDGHPIVIINGKDIIDFIVNELEIRNEEKLKKWLDNNYDTSIHIERKQNKTYDLSELNQNKLEVAENRIY